MIPILDIRHEADEKRLVKAISEICSMCGEKNRCEQCVFTFIRSENHAPVRIPHMDCCCMQPCEPDPEMAERYSAAVNRIGNPWGFFALPEEEKNLLRETRSLEKKLPIVNYPPLNSLT